LREIQPGSAFTRRREVKILVYFGLAKLVATHDFHDDAGDHESEDEYDDVEGYAHYVHENRLVISGL